MSKNSKKSYWNYRVLTRIVHLGKVKKGVMTPSKKDWREFFIAEVHYKDKKPVTYGAEKVITSGWETLKDLKWTVKHLKEAFKKPILDADNWPNEYVIFILR
jgi:hypothetical protein